MDRLEAARALNEIGRRLQIAGGVTGTMRVSYSGSRQSVSISTQGIALQSVTIALTRS